MQVQLENIPQYLKTNGQFCNWKYELRNGNQTKVPYMPGTTQRASVDDPSTFKPFEDAVATKEYNGIGIRVCSSAIRGALFGLRYGRVFQRAGQGRSDHL